MGAGTITSRHLGTFVAAKRQIALRMASPKIVVLGGSNVLYGIRAESLQKALGQPAVNFGFVMNFGPDYLARLAESVLRPGDTLVLSLEYEEYQNTLFRDAMLMQQVFGNDLPYFRSLPPGDQLRWVLGLDKKRIKYGLLVRLGYREKEKPLGVDEVVSPWGDIASNTRANQTEKERQSLYLRRIPDHAALLPDDTKVWPVLLGLRDWCARNRVRLLVTFPPYYFPETPGAAARLDLFFNHLLAFYDRNGFVRLDTPWENLHPREDFFNSEYHLLLDKAEGRTAVLAAELLASEPKSP